MPEILFYVALSNYYSLYFLYNFVTNNDKKWENDRIPIRLSWKLHHLSSDSSAILPCWFFRTISLKYIFTIHYYLRFNTFTSTLSPSPQNLTVDLVDFFQVTITGHVKIFSSKLSGEFACQLILSQEYSENVF